MQDTKNEPIAEFYNNRMWLRLFITITCGSLLGMLLGAGFGYVAALIAPDLFKNLFLFNELEPLGTATVYGASAGVILGGGLAVFTVSIQTFWLWMQYQGQTKNKESTLPEDLNNKDSNKSSKTH